MKSAGTSKPCSRSSSAATAESTPPERPTITREAEADMGANCTRAGKRLDGDSPHGQGRLEVEAGHGLQRLAHAVQVVVHTSQDQGASQPQLTFDELGAGEPM